MPKYDFSCDHCGTTSKDVTVTIAARNDVMLCGDCQYPMKRLFPLGAVRGVKFFSPYYDEMLGMNLHTAEQKASELRKRGMIEAGDKEHGARIFDDSLPTASQIRPMPLRDDRSNKPLVALNRTPDDIPFQIEHENGSTEDVMLSEMEIPKTADSSAAEAAFDHIKTPTK